MGLDDGNSELRREAAGATLDDAVVRWQKVKDLFGDALERDPADRKAFLDQACNGDEALRVEVESLLAAAQVATDELQPGREADRMLGCRLGAYQIVESIASGGMATVYLAHRADDQYSKRVAIKLIHPGLASDALCRRFRSERQTLAALDHPNIVKLLDGGSTEEGLPYLVMDYVDGQPIDEYCDQHQLTVEERLKLFRTVCGAVEHAHQNLIIHRDLKPSNILVTAGGSPKLLDFGIAKLLTPKHSLEMGLMTTAGIHHMTPAYASPEQVRGDAITYASDVYSLGVVLYELLTGHRPYRFKSYRQAEVERVICETEAERPSTMVTRVESDAATEDSSGHVVTPDGVSRARGVPLERLRRRLKGDLDNIVLKALHKEPPRRYGSVHEFSEDIARHLEDQPVKARPNTLQYRTRKLIHRRKTQVIAAAIVLTVLASATAFVSWQERRVKESASTELTSQRSKGRRALAVLGLKNLSGRSDTAWLSTAIAEMLTTELAAGGKLRTISGELVAHANLTPALPETDSLSPETLTLIHKRLGSDYVVWGTYMAKGDSTRAVRVDLRIEDVVTGKSTVVMDSGTDTTLPDLAARLGAQLRDKLGIPDVTPAELASTIASLPSNPDAARFYAEGLGKMRVFDALSARELLEQAIASEPDFALAHSALADAWVALGYDAKGQEEARRAYDLSGKLSREDRLLIEGRYREATHDWNRAVEVYTALFEFFPDNVDYGLKLAKARIKAGQFKDALPTIDALRRLPPPLQEDPRIDLVEDMACVALEYSCGQASLAHAVEKAASSGSVMLLAQVKMRAARLRKTRAEALATYDEARILFTKAGDHNGAAQALHGIATMHYLDGNLVATQKVAEEELATYRANGNEEGISNALSLVAIALAEQGELDTAKKDFAAALASCRKIGSRMCVAIALSNLSELLVQEGDLEAARAMSQEALEIFRELPHQSGVVLALFDLATICYEQGDLAEAEKLREQSEAARQVNDPAGVSAALSLLGRIQLMQGNFIAARRNLEEARAVEKERRQRKEEATILLDIVQLAIEEGRFSEAEQLTRQNAEEFRKFNAPQLRMYALALLAQALAAQNKLGESQHVLAEVLPVTQDIKGLYVRLPVAIVAARTRASASQFSNPAELEQATQMLEAALADAKSHGYLRYQYEARLALGEIDMKSGNAVNGRWQLSALEREAKRKGFALIAQKAAHARLMSSSLPARKLVRGRTKALLLYKPLASVLHSPFCFLAGPSPCLNTGFQGLGSSAKRLPSISVE